MSETVMPEGVNININNSDSNSSEGSSGSFLDKLFDIGLKLIIPLGLLFGLVAILIIVKLVLPLVGFVTDTSNLPGIANLFPPFTGLITSLGLVGGWIFGR
jgi:hypothetical protein